MATPIEHAWRDYEAFLRGPAGYNTYAFASQSSETCYRSGVDHKPLMVDFPAPSDTAPDDFGILAGGGFDVEIFDEPNDDDWPLLAEDGEFLLDEAGTSQLIHEY